MLVRVVVGRVIDSAHERFGNYLQPKSVGRTLLIFRKSRVGHVIPNIRADEIVDDWLEIWD